MIEIVKHDIQVEQQNNPLNDSNYQIEVNSEKEDNVLVELPTQVTDNQIKFEASTSTKMNENDFACR